MGTVRLIGGAWKRRIIRFPDVDMLRPTPDRVRETLFNWLGQDLTGKTCLDLFGGSGILGFEAASRGAKSVTIIESQNNVYRSLQKAAKDLLTDTLGFQKAIEEETIEGFNPHTTKTISTVPTIRIVQGDAFEFLKNTTSAGAHALKFDVVFLDPPFHKGLAATALSKLPPLLSAHALVYIETEHNVELPLISDNTENLNAADIKNTVNALPNHANLKKLWRLLREKSTRQVQYRLLEYVSPSILS